MSDRAEGTFVLLRYSLGGDRPSQTTHHTLSSIRITDLSENANDARLVFQGRPPFELASEVQSLPAILHRQHQRPV